MTFKGDLSGYILTFKKKALKSLQKLDKKTSKAIHMKLESLVKKNHNLDIKKIEKKSHPTYRIRHGNYRIVYETHHDIITVLVIEIDHRKNIYKKI